MKQFKTLFAATMAVAMVGSAVISQANADTKYSKTTTTHVKTETKMVPNASIQAQMKANSNSAVQTGSPVMVRYYNAQDRYLANDFKSAQEYYEELIDEQPNSPMAYYGLSRVYLSEKEYDDALEAINKSIELDPLNSQAYYIKGQILEADGDEEGATKAYYTFAATDPYNIATYDALRRAERLEVKHQGEYSAAQKSFNKGLRELALGNPEAAAEDFARAHSAEPGNAEYKLFLGRAYQQSNQTNLAIDLYEDAIDDSDNVWAQYYLSETYRMDGQNEKAMSTWNELIEAVPNTTVSTRVQIMPAGSASTSASLR